MADGGGLDGALEKGNGNRSILLECVCEREILVYQIPNYKILLRVPNILYPETQPLFTILT